MLRRIPLLACSAALLAMSMPGWALPAAAQANMAAASKALARGDGIAAEAELHRATQAGASKPELAAAMGEALLDQGALAKARVWLAPGQFAPGEAAHGWRMLGKLDRLSGNLPQAGKAFDRALAVAPSDPLLWVEIGRMRYSGGEQLQAIDAAEKALAAAPDNPRTLEFRAELIRDAQGYAAAIPLYQHALEISGNDLGLLGGYAGVLGEAGRAQEMLAVTRHILELAPRNPRAFYLQAVLAARAGQIDLARALLNRTRGQVDTLPSGLLLQGLLELEAGNANVAADQLAVLSDRQPANQRVQLLLARALYTTGDYNQLFARFAALAQRSDAPPYLLTLLGRAHEDQGNRIAAAALLDRAATASLPTLQPIFEPDAPGVLGPLFTADPAAPGHAVPYVRSLLLAQNSSAAARAASQFLQLRPGSSDALALLGDVELVSGAPGLALEHYSLAAQVRFPDLLLLRIGDAYDKLGQGRAAQPVVAQYLSAFPGSRLAARMAANQAALNGDWPTALLLLESLRARGGNSDVRLLADLSLAQLRSGDSPAALLTAQRAWHLQPSSPVAAQALGMAMAAGGQNSTGARQLLDQARRMGGDNRLLQESLARLH